MFVAFFSTFLFDESNGGKCHSGLRTTMSTIHAHKGQNVPGHLELFQFSAYDGIAHNQNEDSEVMVHHHLATAPAT
jgi:hypothetical protein